MGKEPGKGAPGRERRTTCRPTPFRIVSGRPSPWRSSPWPPSCCWSSASQRADAKAKAHTHVVKGPKGLKFYKPPKNLPKQHGTLIWARKATGLVPLADAKYTKLVLYSSRTPQGAEGRGLGIGQRPQGQAAEGRLAGDHLGTRDHRRRRRLRTVA